MSDISKWSNTAGGNSSPAPDGAPEGMSPASVNDTMREIMAATRRQWEGKEYFNFGDTPTYSSSTSLTVPGNLTARYHANRRIVATGTGAMGTIYGTLSAPTYNSGPNNTTVNVAWDSGSLDSTLASVGLGAAATNDAEPRIFNQQAQQAYALDTGTTNTYQAAYSPAITALTDGMKLRFKAKTANTGASTFSPNGITASPIYGAAHSALQGGEIQPNSDIELIWNSSLNAGNGAWVVLESTGGAVQVAPATQPNHAAQFGQLTRQLQSISASVASNALTLGLNPGILDFRSSPLSSGTVNTRTFNSQISLTVPSGATLGTTSGQTARLAVLAIDNAGTVELAVVNLAGGVNLDETTLINTTAVSGSSTAANVVYSAISRANVPFRVVGFVDVNEATAGTWAAAPTTVQGIGGQALASLQSLGFGQTMQNVTASRASGTTYTNSTGRPIFVTVTSANSGSAQGLNVNVSGVTFGGAVVANSTFGISFIVPPGATYSVTVTTGAIGTWVELR